MIAFAIVMAVFTSYLLAGWKIAIRNLPRAWEVARKSYFSKEYIRGSVKAQTICMFLFWPYYWIFIRLASRLNSVIDAHDPEVLRDRLAKLERRNRELERELGIGRQ